MEHIFRFRINWLLSLLIFLVALSVSLLGFSGSAEAVSTNRNQFVANVNNDTFGDAITFDPRTGDWWVAISNGSNSFDTPSRWISGFGVGSSKQFVANAGGGSGADLVTFDSKTGDWWVAISNNTNNFQAPSRWISGHGVGSKNQLLGDTNNDGRVDATVFFDNGPSWNGGPDWGSGAWWVAISNNTNFGPSTVWFNRGHGVGSTDQFIADVDDDSKADAVIVGLKGMGAQWAVSNSDGVHFATGPNIWINGHGVGSSKRLLSDVNSDGRADAIIFYESGVGDRGQWLVAPAGGPGSNVFASPTVWISRHGAGSTNQLVGDVTGDGKGDAVVFFESVGNWHIAPSNGTNFHNGDPNYYPPRWISGFGVGT